MFDSESPNSAEFVYEKKSRGKVRLQRALMITLYVVFTLAYFLFCYISRINTLFAIAPILVYILYLLTWRFVKYDCYWEFRSGLLSAGIIRSRRSGKERRPTVSLTVSNAIDIFALTDSSKLSDVKRRFDFSEAFDSDKRICVIFDHEGEKAALIIEGTAKLAKLLAAYSPSAQSIKSMTFHG